MEPIKESPNRESEGLTMRNVRKLETEERMTLQLDSNDFLISLLCQRPQFVTPFTYENFIYANRCQTTTTLVRCFRAPKTNSGMTLGLADVP